MTFVNNVRHPLNERIEIEVDHQTFTMAHLPKVDAAAGTVEFEHGALTGTMGVKGGAIAALIVMNEEKEGPEVLNVLFHNYADSNKSTFFMCSNLSFVH